MGWLLCFVLACICLLQNAQLSLNSEATTSAAESCAEGCGKATKTTTAARLTTTTLAKARPKASPPRCPSPRLMSPSDWQSLPIKVSAKAAPATLTCKRRHLCCSGPSLEAATQWCGYYLKASLDSAQVQPRHRLVLCLLYLSVSLCLHVSVFLCLCISHSD